jgi:hypothetical protein
MGKLLTIEDDELLRETLTEILEAYRPMAFKKK